MDEDAVELHKLVEKVNKQQKAANRDTTIPEPKEGDSNASK